MVHCSASRDDEAALLRCVQRHAAAYTNHIDPRALVGLCERYPLLAQLDISHCRRFVMPLVFVLFRVWWSMISRVDLTQVSEGIPCTLWLHFQPGMLVEQTKDRKRARSTARSSGGPTKRKKPTRRNAALTPVVS